MHLVTDKHGTRELTDAQYAQLIAEGEAELAAFWNAREWRPIADYQAGEVVLVRNGEEWAVAMFATSIPEMVGEDADLSAMWRDVREPFMEGPLGFEPLEFATADDEWLSALCED